MAEGDADAEPQRKKIRLQSISDDPDPVFKTFYKDINNITKLRTALHQLCDTGAVKMAFWKISESNARECIQFSKAFCTLKWYEKPGFVPAAVFFRQAKDMLQIYCSKTEPAIPTEKNRQDLLSKLLKYLTSYHGQLMYQESKKETNQLHDHNWAIIIAQHLFTELTMEKECLIDRYHGINLDMTTCVCEKHDDFKGKFSDTSFGCVEAWHGKADILLDGNSSMSVAITDEGEEQSSDLDLEEEEKTVERSVSSAGTIYRKEEMQVTAQTIVYSFLQRKMNRESMKTCLVPGIAIGNSNYRLFLYDSENDVLVSSMPGAALFDDSTKDLNCTVAVLLWMILNYRYLCSGVPEKTTKFEINDIKAGFFERVGDCLKIYQENVARPAHPRPSQVSSPKGQGITYEDLLDSPEVDKSYDYMPLF